MKMNVQLFGGGFPPYYGLEKFWEKKLAKAEIAKAKSEAIVEICKKKLEEIKKK